MKMAAYDFTASEQDGSVRVVTFYSYSRAQAFTIAKDWARRTGHTIVEPAKAEAA